MRVTYDPDKRARTLEERGLDFEDAAVVFDGPTVEIEDSARLWRAPDSLLRLAVGPVGCRRLRIEGSLAPRLQYEKGERP